jgi:hypothetical protein
MFFSIISFSLLNSSLLERHACIYTVKISKDNYGYSYSFIGSFSFLSMDEIIALIYARSSFRFGCTLAVPKNYSRKDSLY